MSVLLTDEEFAEYQALRIAAGRGIGNVAAVPPDPAPSMTVPEAPFEAPASPAPEAPSA